MPTPLALRLNRTVESRSRHRIDLLGQQHGIAQLRAELADLDPAGIDPAMFATAGNMREGASAGPWPRMRPCRSVSFDIPLLLSEITACGERL